MRESNYKKVCITSGLVVTVVYLALQCTGVRQYQEILRMLLAPGE